MGTSHCSFNQISCLLERHLWELGPGDTVATWSSVSTTYFKQRVYLFLTSEILKSWPCDYKSNSILTQYSIWGLLKPYSLRNHKNFGVKYALWVTSWEVLNHPYPRKFAHVGQSGQFHFELDGTVTSSINNKYFSPMDGIAHSRAHRPFWARPCHPPSDKGWAVPIKV